jgi:urease accessory protein
MIIITATIMSDAPSPDAAALYRLMAWLSPAYPVGAFSYSSGIEWAVESGDIKDAETLRAWLAVMIGEGSGFCDAVFFVHAHRASAANDDASLRAVAELAAAMAPSKERLLETATQGRAFLDATRAAWPCEALARLDAAWNGAVALPVAVGVTCAGHGIACEAALQAFLHALTANWISAGVRLIPLGQTDGQRVLAALEATVTASATRAKRRWTTPAPPRCAPISPACGTRRNIRGCSGRKHRSHTGVFSCRRSAPRPALADPPVSCRHKASAGGPTWSGPAPRW